MHQDLRVRRSERRAALRIVGWEVLVQVHEVGYDLDVAGLASECAVGLLPQVLRDRRDRVGAFDRELGHGEEGALPAHQGDVRPVQRGDHLQVAMLPHHLSCEERGGCVWHRVVHVQDVQLLAQGHLFLGDRQRQRVREVLQERVRAAEIDLVEVHALREAAQPKR